MRQVAAPELAALCAALPPESGAAVLLDVREPWEFALAAIRIEGARTLHMPMGEVPDRLHELNPAQPVVCICHHGVRSAQVVAFLERCGFESAYNLAGGIDGWSASVDGRVPRY